MQKVIIVNLNSREISTQFDFNEIEIPSVNDALEEGYSVSQLIPVLKQADVTGYYSLIFVLDKSEK
ncbi:hypothetical protein [uncultured Mucilaginibacter sp.]|uniref:hypothetical protein n=1 Tax=uncultured Mucilaginibacter sp. TaxID=797541 RepID=UPI0026136E3F|nr:hypothetical protein [uncultured Mucilaginibacter sp.]